MSKKTQKKTLKKSPKTPAAKATKARSTASAKKPAAKKRSTSANKPAPTASKSKTSAKIPVETAAKTVTKTVTKPVAKTAAKIAAPKASHQGASKPLTLPAAAAASRPAAPESNAAAAKPKTSAAKTSPVSATAEAGHPPAPTGGHAALSEGANAPAFHLPRDGGDTVSLADFAGRKLVLFFYPRADTPGCTKEAIDFTRLASAFADAQTAVLGVSADPLKAQEAFRDKHELAVPLASDEKHEMLEAYGVWGEKSMYGRTFLGILRTTVLIGANGRIVKIWRHVKVDGHADEVLAAAQAA
jgi:thioredoxin-dependent peroxiredoxin